MRERRFKSIIITSFYIPSEQIEILNKAKQNAAANGLPLSALIVKALAEYIQVHIDEVNTPYLTTYQNMRAVMITRVKKRLDVLLNRPYPNKEFWRDEVEKVFIKISKNNLHDAELDKIALVAIEKLKLLD